MASPLQSSPSARAALNKRFPGDTPRYDPPNGVTSGGNALAAALGAAGPSAAGGMSMAGGNALAPGGSAPSSLPPGMVPNPLASGGMSPAQALQPQPPAAPASSPGSDPDSILAQVTRHVAGQRLSPDALDQQMQEHIAGMQHIDRLLAKGGDRITRADLTKAAIEAVQVGAISSNTASRFLDAHGDTPPPQMAARLRGVMGDLAMASTAIATAKHQQAQQPPGPAAALEGAV